MTTEKRFIVETDRNRPGYWAVVDALWVNLDLAPYAGHDEGMVIASCRSQGWAIIIAEALNEEYERRHG